MLVRALEIKDKKLFDYVMFCVKNQLKASSADSLKKYHQQRGV